MRKLIVYGNCQAAAVSNVLARAPGIAGALEVVHHEVWATGDELKANVAAFGQADILALQVLRNWRTHPLRDNLPAGLRVVRFPFCYLAALWPFDAFIFGPDRQAPERFAFQDGLMAQLRAETPDPAERFARYCALDMPGLPDLRRYAELEEARLLREDARLETGIGRFVVDTYRSERLFHAVSHPTPLLVERIACEVLRKLDLDPGLENVPRFHDYLGYFQVPVHPRVIEALALRWVDGETLYSFHRDEQLSFEAYYRRYIDAG